MKKVINSKAALLAAAAIASTVSLPAAHAAGKPFSNTELATGFNLGHDKDASGGGEGKCGTDPKTCPEGKCGEGKCGEQCNGKPQGDDQQGSDGQHDAEGKCGEGKCGEAMDEGSGEKQGDGSGHDGNKQEQAH